MIIKTKYMLFRNKQYYFISSLLIIVLTIWIFRLSFLEKRVISNAFNQVGLEYRYFHNKECIFQYQIKCIYEKKYNKVFYIEIVSLESIQVFYYLSDIYGNLKLLRSNFDESTGYYILDLFSGSDQIVKLKVFNKFIKTFGIQSSNKIVKYYSYFYSGSNSSSVQIIEKLEDVDSINNVLPIGLFDIDSYLIDKTKLDSIIICKKSNDYLYWCVEKGVMKFSPKFNGTKLKSINVEFQGFLSKEPR